MHPVHFTPAAGQIVVDVRDQSERNRDGILPGAVALGAVISEIGNVSYYAMLSEVSTPKTVGRVSGLGWGLGYIGGVVALILCIPILFGVGQNNPLAYKLVAVLCAVLLTGTAVTLAGPIGFVALIAPHLARGLAGRAVPPPCIGRATPKPGRAPLPPPLIPFRRPNAFIYSRPLGPGATK